VKRESTSLKVVEMINQEHVDRLTVLSVDHLNCSLDDNAPGYIPQDLVPGTYRWFLYMYSNMYKEGDSTLVAEDRAMFIEIAGKFRSEHLISWTRDRLIELDESKIALIYKFIHDALRSTNSFYTLKVCVHMLKCLDDGWYFTDSFVLKNLPELKGYILNG